MAKGFVINIEEETRNNLSFRKVLYTSKHSQLVIMNIPPKEEIGEEAHSDNDQFLRIEEGIGKVIIDDNEYQFADGFAIVVPAGAKHNVINTSDALDLKLYTLYSPAHHKSGTIHETKEDAQNSDEEFDGITSEL